MNSENVDSDVTEHLHQAYRLVHLFSALFQSFLSVPDHSTQLQPNLNTGSAGTGPQLTPSGGWRRAQNLKAATSSRVVSPSRSPCPSSSSPVQLSSLHLLFLLSHIKSRCAGASQRGEGGLDGARHPCHARHARYPRQARSLGLEHGGEGGKCWGAVILPRNNRHSPYFGVIL